MPTQSDAVQTIAFGFLLVMVYLLVQGSFSSLIFGIIIFIYVLYLALKSANF